MKSQMSSATVPIAEPAGLPVRRSRVWLVLTMAVATAAYAVAGCCLVALTWDGAGYVFNTIQRGHPAIPCNRYSDYPFLCVLFIFSRLINDPRWLAAIYGLVLALLPLGSLLLSFHFLSGPQLRSLRIWPVLGILLSALPGQVFLTAEAVPLAQVSWAVWAIVAAEISTSSLVWLAILTLFLFYLHPMAALTYGVAGALFFGKTRLAIRQRRIDVWLGIAFLGLAAIRLWYGLVTANSYERGEETFAQNYLAFCNALPSLRMLPFVYLLGLAILGGAAGRLGQRLAVWLSGVTLGLLLLYGLAWAADPNLWVAAFSFRRFLLVGTLPLVALGALHWWYENGSVTAQDPENRRKNWGPVMLSCAAVFFFVFVTQAFTWRHELARFQADLNACAKAVANVDDLSWIPGTPLNHWASTPLSCVIQGQKVKKLFALHSGDIRGRAIFLFPDIWFRPRNRWFEFELSRQASSNSR